MRAKDAAADLATFTIEFNKLKYKGVKELAPSVGRVGWFNAGRHRPTRDGYYEFRARGYRVDPDKWSFLLTDGYCPVRFDLEEGVWELSMAGIGSVFISAGDTEFLRAYEWRGLSELGYRGRGGKDVL
jgi:hypothetical protein